jgi:hypothetical protein
MEHSQSNFGLDQCHNCGVRRKQVANPTTNYGFVLPTPTDLVTDLPADFDVALQGVDTQLKALQPGTTLGDLAYSSASANTNTRLAIGSTNDVLTVAGGVPTWAAPSSPTFVGASIYNSTTQSIANSTYTILNFDSEAFDSDAFHSTATNTSRLTIPAGKSGKYQVTAALGWETTGTYNYGSVLLKNGIAYHYLNFTNATTSGSLNSWSFVIDLVATDYLEWQVFQAQGGPVNAKGDNNPTERTTFSINYLGA